MRSLLQQNIVFKEFTADELDEIIQIAQRVEYEANQLVFSQKQAAQFIFIVESGSFLLNMPNADAKIFKAGDIFGEIAIINKNMRSGTVRAQEKAVVCTLCGTRIFNPDFVRPATALKLIRALSIKITNYLRSREQISTSEIIQAGESEYIEFKSSLRWNKHTGKKDTAIEHAALKTIAAFLNAEGGTLLVGVNDEGEILGLSDDQFQNEDKVLLHLNKLIKDRIGPLQTRFVNAEVEKINDKHVLRVDCEAATLPSYLHDRGTEYFYVRTGPASTSLKLSKVYDYIRLRFYSQQK